AEAFYGRANGNKRIERANPSLSKRALKAGETLRIVGPVYFPNLDEIKKKQEQFHKTTGEAATPSATVIASSPLSTLSSADDEKDITIVPRPKVNKAFAPGEKLKYQVKVLSLLAGYATVEVGDYVTVENRPCYPLIAKARTAFPFSTFFNVDDIQTSYFDAIDFISWKFENNVVEGKFKATNLELFHQIKHKLVRHYNQDKVEETDIPAYDQDIISCFYYFRLLPIEVGKKYAIPTTAQGKNYKLITRVAGRETITIPAGTFDAFKLKPIVKYGSMFRNSETIDLWVTADSRHIPLLVRSSIIIGSIEIALLEATIPEIAEDGANFTSRLSQ
ncbi:MAG TPA: DUF3108 domain-containing protein, partial [bacterium]